LRASFTARAWQGSAWDQEHALERCYGAHDESVPTLMLVELQELKPVKISSKMSAPGWVTVWTNG